MHYGLALTLNHEDAHRSIGQHGSLLGFASAMYEFPDDKITVIVLTNTESQNAYAIERALRALVLGLPEHSVCGGRAGAARSHGRTCACSNARRWWARSR